MSIRLELYKGIPPTSTEFVEPPFTGGGTGAADPEMQFLDLLAPGLGLTNFSWVPAIPGLKAGIWNDSATQTGRQLQAQPNTNAIETFTFTAPTRAAGLYMIERLLDYGRAARDYHESDIYTPVQLRYTTDTGKDNWALIYNVQASFSAFGAVSAASSAVDVEVTIERESFWRPIPFRWNPKAYTLENRGQDLVLAAFGTAARPNGSGEYNVTNLTLNSGTGDYTSAVEANIRMGEESFSTTARNFIDIPAGLIPGDAPADVEFTIDMPSPSNSARILVAKTSMFNWSSARYSAGNLNGLTHTYSSSDALINPTGAPANITTTQPVTADGFLDSLGTRRVSQHVFGAGVAGSAPVLRWSLWHYNFKGRYNVFLRHTCAANATDVQVYFTLAIGSTILYTSTARRLDTTIAGYRAGSMSLGELDMSILDFPPVGVLLGDGAQTNVNKTFNIQLHFIKTAATTPTVLTWDLTLLPIDEGYVEITPNLPTQLNDAILYDNTSYASSSSATGHTALFGSNSACVVLGAPVKLTPNTRNRLIFYIQNNLGTFSPTQEYPIRINVLPRWSGLRA